MKVDATLRPGLRAPREWAVRLAAARWAWKPTLLFIVTRLGLFFVAYLAAPLLPDSATPPVYHLRSVDNLLVDVFGSRWDTGFYVSIAEEGYFFEGVPLPSVAFFPLLPLMMRALTPLTGDPLVSGLLISNLASLLAVILFYRLVEGRWGEATAERAVWYLLIFPTAFFGAALYTESLFLLLTIGALLSARRGYWEIAGLLGIAAALTRLIGLIVLPLLLVEWYVQRRERSEGERPAHAALLAPLLAPLGTLAYMVYLWRTFGDSLAFVKASAAWAREPASPLALVRGLLKTPAGGWFPALLAGRVHVDNWIDFGFIGLFIILGLALLYQRRWTGGVYVLTGALVSLSSGLLMSQRRYVWVLFPAFVLLARWGEKPWVDRLITTLSLMGLALFTALFANGYWVG